MTRHEPGYRSYQAIPYKFHIGNKAVFQKTPLQGINRFYILNSAPPLYHSIAGAGINQNVRKICCLTAIAKHADPQIIVLSQGDGLIISSIQNTFFPEHDRHMVHGVPPFGVPQDFFLAAGQLAKGMRYFGVRLEFRYGSAAEVRKDWRNNEGFVKSYGYDIKKLG